MGEFWEDERIFFGKLTDLLWNLKRGYMVMGLLSRDEIINLIEEITNCGDKSEEEIDGLILSISVDTETMKKSL